MPPLKNQKHDLFCFYHASGLNLSESYKIVYPKVKSTGSASTLAGRLLKKVEVKERLDELKAENLDDNKAKIKRYEDRLEEIAFKDSPEVESSIRASDSIKALDMYGKFIGANGAEGDKNKEPVHVTVEVVHTDASQNT